MEIEQTDLPIGSLRIGLFTDTYAPQVNGVSVSLQMISKGLEERGHQVTIFAPKFPGYKDDKRNVMRLPSLKYLNNPPIYVAVLGTPRSTWKLTREHFDVLHAHSPASMGLLAYLTASTKRLPLIYTYHTSITDYTHYIKFIGGTGLIKRAAAWFSKASTDLGDQIIVPSPKFYRLLLQQKVKQPITIIPNGIDLSMFETVKNPGVLRKQLGIAEDAPIMLTVGRMDPEKRLDFIVDAFNLLIDRVPNAHLVFAGDGGARKGVEEKANASKGKDHIHFLGMVNRADLPDIFHDADVFLSASTTEVHPISVIEAIASGLPFVAVKDEAFEGMLENGMNGYETPLDVNQYADILADLLPDRERLKQFGEHSLTLSRKYSIETQVRSLEKLYTEAILQNWRGTLFQRMLPKQLQHIPKRITQEITGIPQRISDEITKRMPGQKK
ncbi:MAG: glycosyltransferase [Anaerolineales bacterium]|nr:glycosyltransferase [Anaerolineales bacterium]MCB9144417.1 glycosyltransferase [Anaerolineales bacterium]